MNTMTPEQALQTLAQVAALLPKPEEENA